MVLFLDNQHHKDHRTFAGQLAGKKALRQFRNRVQLCQLGITDALDAVSPSGA
jgi:hypothetical protein